MCHGCIASGNLAAWSTHVLTLQLLLCCTVQHSWMEVSMLLSTPSRLLVLTKLQMLLEMPLS